MKEKIEEHEINDFRKTSIVDRNWLMIFFEYHFINQKIDKNTIEMDLLIA
ncbi:MAG: hypothetical protein K9H16_15680 [Bacteroidales bacterium]|nr:hypothetical protein [Bacteroidales bacterium]